MKRPSLRQSEAALRKLALAYPEATEDFPWGHRAIKVRGKAFVFMSLEKDTFSLSAKIPDSNSDALMFPFAEPTHYGLGKSGWVTATFKAGDSVPVELLGGWIDESYHEIAPKKLSAPLLGLTNGHRKGRTFKAPARKKAVRKKLHSRTTRQNS
jgi:predicted DNA-binding protein (MmcQ/YjbR family)